MSERNLRWLTRRIDYAILFWFTTYLFWVNRPVMKWVFLVFCLLESFASNDAQTKEEKFLGGK